ncbi:MAG TPA: N-acetylmuramoyl-L-alanine amidase [Thermodesulfovibrionales bacterium]|nr:N-acetylmuramoyl-L-alanine amidase [Thermodesulfovibrionales bacterium]
MVERIEICAVLVILLLFGAGYAVETGGVKPKAGENSGTTGAEVSVRSSRNEGVSRIVFEAPDESFIKNAVVTPLQSQIKIQFPSNFTIKTEGTIDLDTSLKGRNYLINVTAPFKMKILRLSGPPRLSIDIMTVTKEEERKPIPAEVQPAEKFPGYRIVLDAGHGGYDLGIISGDLREKDITLSAVREIEAALVKKKRPVSLTRRADQFLSLTDRALSAGQKSPDIFLSLHLSLSDSFVIYTSFFEPEGMEPSPADYYHLMSVQRRYLERSKTLAEMLGKAIKDEFKTEIIFREMSLPLLNSVAAPAVLIELPKTILYDNAVRARLSDAILKGIALYAAR